MKNVMKADIYRVLGSKLPWLTVFLFTLARTLVAIPEYLALYRQFPGKNVAQNLGYLYYSSFFLSSNVNVFSVSIACLPFGMAYLEDKESNFDRYFISRTNMMRYSLSKFIVNLCTSAAAVILGFMLTILLFILLCQRHAGTIMAGDGSQVMRDLSQNTPLAYSALLIIFSALYCAFWSSFAMTISAYLSNIYVIFSLSYAGILLTSQLQLSKIGWPMFSNFAMKGSWLAMNNINLYLAIGLNILQYAFLYVISFYFFHRRIKLNYERK